MDSTWLIIAVFLSLVAICLSFYLIVTRSNKHIREEKELDPETKRLLDEALELEEGIID